MIIGTITINTNVLSKGVMSSSKMYLRVLPAIAGNPEKDSEMRLPERQGTYAEITLVLFPPAGGVTGSDVYIRQYFREVLR